MQDNTELTLCICIPVFFIITVFIIIVDSLDSLCVRTRPQESVRLMQTNSEDGVVGLDVIRPALPRPVG